MYRGEFIFKNADDAWDFLKDSSDKLYEWRTIRKAPSIVSKIIRASYLMTLLLRRVLCFLMNISLKFLFSTTQPHDYISPSYSYDFLLYYSVSSYSNPFNQMPFEGVSDPSIYPLMINPHFKTKGALMGDMLFDDAPFLLGPLRENNKSDKLVVKVSCDFVHDMIVVSKDTFIEEEYSLEETHLEEPCV